MSRNRPRHRRFDDPQLDICWAALESVDDARQYTLLQELATHLAHAAGDPRTPANKVAAAIVSLRTAAEILVHSPTLIEYRSLRTLNPELELVPDGTLRRWLGLHAWNDCLARALLDAVSDGDFVTMPQGDAFTEETLVVAIRECIAYNDGAVPTLAGLLSWAHDPRVRARLGQRPLSWTPFQRYGGYRAVLERNGIVTDSLRRDGRRTDATSQVRILRRRLAGGRP